MMSSMMSCLEVFEHASQKRRESNWVVHVEPVAGIGEDSDRRAWGRPRVQLFHQRGGPANVSRHSHRSEGGTHQRGLFSAQTQSTEVPEGGDSSTSHAQYS
mmetsp:Transcript_78874/g.109588  ORF Transcript_78874/g.109588 Transcript_78874/m.109588 type:complete len:101 (-) Transcript_78874:929-1231(-)